MPLLLPLRNSKRIYTKLAARLACRERSRLRNTQYHFPDVLAVVDIAVGCSGLFERKRLADERLDFAGAVEPEELVQFLRQDRAAGFEMAEMHSDDGGIVSHELQGVEASRGDISFGSAPQAALSIRSGGRGEAKNGETPHRTEAAVALRKGFSTDRVHHHLDALRDGAAYDIHKILARVIDGIVDADLTDIFLLGRAGCAEHFQVACFRQLHSGAPYPAGDAVDQDVIARLQIAHHKHNVVGRKIVDRNRRGLFERDPCRQAKDAFHWGGDSLGVTGEFGERHDALADLERTVTR